MTTKIKSGVISDNAITSAHISSGAISSAHLSSIDTDAVSEGSSNLYFTTTRARTSLSVTDSGGDGSLAYDNSTGVITYTGPSASEVRAHISVTDSGGDGSLAYSNGVITYVGPSAAEVRAHLSAGTGVTYSSGEFSIGQSVATTASPTFADINITGDLNLTGDINSYSVTDLDIVDQTITLGVGQSESASDGSGIVIAGSSASILWDEANDEWDFNKGVNVTGNIGVSGTVDGVDIAARDAVLTSTTTTAAAALPKAGGTMTGSIVSNSNIKTTGHIEIASAQPRILLDRNDGSYAWNIYNGDGSGNFPLSTFNIANNAGTAVITALDNGNVGIGTTNPNSPLEIVKNITFTNSDTFPQLLIKTTATTTGNQLGLGVDETDNVAFIEAIDRGNNVIPLVLQRNAGRVGIGNDNPGAPLDVAGNFIFKSPTNTLYGNFDTTTAGYGAFRLQNQGSNYGFIGQTSSLLASGGSDTALGLRSENEFAIATGGSTERMRITSGGNVGIGTDSPTGSGKILHFNSSSNVADFHVTNSVTGATSTDGFILRVTDPADVEYINREGATTDQIWYQGSTRVMSIRASSGNVAIGSHNPASKLHIVGPGGGVTTDLRICSPDNNTSRLTVAEDTTGDQHGAFFEYKGGDLDKTQIGVINNYTESNLIMFRDNTYAGFGSNLTNPLQNLVVGTTTNYDPPGLGNTNANFAILKRDSSSSGDYGIITGISNDGNVWSQVQRTDGTATAYNYYLQPSGGSVGIGIPQNHPYIPNLIYPLRVAKQRSGTGNVTDYLAKIAIDGMGYGGSNYQMAAVDFTGGDTAGKSGNVYGRIGCSSMNGANNAEEGSLEFFVRAPGYSMETAEAMKICGKAGTGIAGGGQHRNGVLFPFQGIAIDRTWANYPGIAVGNSSHYSSTASTQAEFRFHGANFSSDSYPGTSGSDFSVNVRADGSFISTSDGRAKTNITTIDNALSKVNQLTGKRFQRINRSNEPQEHLSKNGYKFGFIAQEIEDIIPEAVQYHADEDDGTENWNSAYAMDYGSVVALLVNAIKEQDTTIQDLKTRIETLEG